MWAPRRRPLAEAFVETKIQAKGRILVAGSHNRYILSYILLYQNYLALARGEVSREGNDQILRRIGPGSSGVGEQFTG
jgi:hypothetical protein